MPHESPTHLIDDALWSRSITHEIASQLSGQTLQLFYGDLSGNTHAAELHVTAFVEKPDADGMKRFSLLFQGPKAPQLPAQTYRTRHPALGDFATFISATGLLPEGYVYEAVFSHAA
ncbi:hypothetical protein G7048_23115 [Diaphorobacter sp. HDW4B]|uniref:DUF6916 family protein n=1 Tax=Diaphorobacter sp. HDW4B TaxID=2714925 RepID=UPI00140899E4|nr:hypothetical protein [Diaphorobacter sp. HDW4B]QIL72984.1 hypothetical protein G7048_23115 [Diaphorobacter sp. HDW4B]